MHKEALLKMQNKKLHIIIAAVVFACAIAIALYFRGRDSGPTYREVRPSVGDLSTFITAVGTVQPQNRIEIKPPISGRVEKVMVREGRKVRAGQALALLSSVERAALLDAARAQGEESVGYWEDVYKPTLLLSPIDGEVIVRAVEPGQTVTANDVIVVISDRLIIKAQVDETDIGRVRLNQKAEVTLDAYPDIIVESRVDHISYESRLINNVTIYEVDILPKRVPDVFRSGMSATVKIIEHVTENALLIPREAVQYEPDASYVLVKDKKGGISKRKVVTGESDDSSIQIKDGIRIDDTILIKTSPSRPSKKAGQGSPLVPFGRQRK